MAKTEFFLSLFLAFLYTYFLIHYPQNVKILGQTSTKSEFKVYEVNYETSNDNKTPVPTFRSNYIYLIHLFDGRKVLICQLFNQLKSNELYDWLNQVRPCSFSSLGPWSSFVQSCYHSISSGPSSSTEAVSSSRARIEPTTSHPKTRGSRA